MFPDPDQGQRDGVCERHYVLQGEERNPRRGQRGRLQRLCPAAGRHHAEERARNPQPRRHSLRQRVHRTRDAGAIMTMLLSSFIHVLCLLCKQSMHFLTALIVHFYRD